MKTVVFTLFLSMLFLAFTSFKMPDAPDKELSIQTGVASFYNDKHHGKKTASGEIYHNAKFTAAHRSLPFGTEVKVTNLSNGKSVNVRINDRGPFVKGRLIDLSKAAAREIGILKKGLARVKIEYQLQGAAASNR